MNRTTVAILVVGVGAAVFLFVRGQQQQQTQLGFAQQQAAAAAAGGGGITGFAQGLWQQWKGDPLGIKQTQATVKGVIDVGKSAASSVYGAGKDVVNFFGGLF